MGEEYEPVISEKGRSTSSNEEAAMSGERLNAQPVCEQHWQALRFIPTLERGTNDGH